MKTFRYWTTIGKNQYGQDIPAEVLVTEGLPAAPHITQQTTVNPHQAAAVPPAPAAPTVIHAQPSYPAQRLSPLPVVSVLLGAVGLFTALSARSQMEELQSKARYQDQVILQLQSQIRDRDIQIQSYERMAAIVK